MLNVVTIAGRPTAAIELKTTSAGTMFADFTLAHDDGAKDKKVTYFFDFTAWGKTAELLAQYVGKGDLIAVRGRLVQRKWTAQDGSSRSAIEVRAEEVQFLARKQAEAAPDASAPAAAPSPAPTQAAPQPVQASPAPQMPMNTYVAPAPQQFSALTPDEDLPF